LTFDREIPPGGGGKGGLLVPRSEEMKKGREKLEKRTEAREATLEEKGGVGIVAYFCGDRDFLDDKKVCAGGGVYNKVSGILEISEK